MKIDQDEDENMEQFLIFVEVYLKVRGCSLKLDIAVGSGML